MGQELHQDMVDRFRKFINVFTNAYGNVALKPFKITYSTHIKAWLGVIYIVRLRILNRRKYVFENFRNKELIDCLKPQEVLILGGKQDLHICLRKGYELFRTGGIIAAILIAWRYGRMAPLKLQIKLARKILKGHKKYLFLWEDNLPVGIFFALLGNSCDLATVCIEHGFESGGALFYDGDACQYNLLYAIEQKELIRSSNSTFFELGPPFDVVYTNDISNEVVLVGTGEHEYRPAFYSRSIDVYSRIQERLRGHGWNVIYRPHPGEHKSEYSPYFSAIDEGTKVACLSGPRKIFIGYVSTLLYEAKAFGHSVICVTDPAMRKVAFIPNSEIDADGVANIENIVGHLHSEMKTTLVRRLPSIRDRFLSILRKIESHH